MRVLLSVILSVLAVVPAQSFPADVADKMIRGEWQSSLSNTWIFTEGQWAQYVGGALFKSEYSISGMPANLAKIISTTTGNAYVLHFYDETMFTVFADGSQETLGVFRKLTTD